MVPPPRQLAKVALDSITPHLIYTGIACRFSCVCVFLVSLLRIAILHILIAHRRCLSCHPSWRVVIISCYLQTVRHGTGTNCTSSTVSSTRGIVVRWFHIASLSAYRSSCQTLPTFFFSIIVLCIPVLCIPVSHIANRIPVPLIVSSVSTSTFYLQTARRRYHRILDLRKFRQMVADGRIPPEGFTTVRSGSSEQLLRYISDEAHIVDYFKDYVDTKARQRDRRPLR